MRRFILVAGAALLVNLTATRLFAQTQDTTKKTTTTATATTGELPTGDVVNALNSNPDYTSAAAAVKAAGLETTLKTGGPYTIFAPNNIAFSNLPAGKLDSLTKDPVKLATLLKGHVVTGHYSKAELIKALTAGKGKVTLTTLDGKPLLLSIVSGKLQLTTVTGGTAQVTLYDLVGSNGIVNGINGILK